MKIKCFCSIVINLSNVSSEASPPSHRVQMQGWRQTTPQFVHSYLRTFCFFDIVVDMHCIYDLTGHEALILSLGFGDAESLLRMHV